MNNFMSSYDVFKCNVNDDILYNYIAVGTLHYLNPIVVFRFVYNIK